MTAKRAIHNWPPRFCRRNARNLRLRTKETPDGKLFGEVCSGFDDFPDGKRGFRGELHAVILRLLVDGDGNTVYSKVLAGGVFGPFSDSSAAAFPTRPFEAGVRSTGCGADEEHTDEGKIQPGRGRQIANMLMDGGVGIGAKDLTDGLSGAVFKSWYMIPVSCVTPAFFSNGGDVNLKRGAKLEVVSQRN